MVNWGQASVTNSILRQAAEADVAYVPRLEARSSADKHTGRTPRTDGSSLSFECITTLDGLAGLRRDWLALEADCPDCASLFQSHDWCMAWAETFVPHDDHHELFVIALRNADRLVCVLPAMVCRKSGVRILRTLSEPYAQYSDILCHPGWQTDATLDILLEAIASSRIADVIHLRHVREGSFAGRFVRRHLTPTGYRETAPFMDLSAFDSEKAYLARYTKVQRRRRKKIAAAIEKLGNVSFEAHTAGSEYEELVRNAVGNKQVWIAERGLYSLPLTDPRLVNFLLALARRRGGAGLQPVITTLKAGGRCISHEVGLRYHGRHCAFITGHDPDLTDLSPARLHMDRSQRLALSDGMHTFDLMVPGDPYKASWSSGAINVEDYAAALTMRGWLHCTLYIRLLRPLARLAYRHAPAWARLKALKAMSMVQALAAK